MAVVEQHLGTVVTCSGAALLLWAGVPRLRRGAGTRRRLSGLAEILLAAWVLFGPGRGGAVALAAMFGLFSAVHLRALADLRRGGSLAACDCFDAEEQVAPARAAGLTGALGLLAVGAAAAGAPSLRELAGADPAALAWTPTAAILLALLWRVAFSGVQVLAGLTGTSGRLIERVPSRTEIETWSEDGLTVERRSFLLRVAVFGSALAVAPLRYVLYPGTALAAVVRPGDCASGDCTDGYTAFCCEITQGQSNTCPTGTFPGGWWMCTDYAGRQLCSDQGVRYYVDCNALPGHPFPGGCRCANDNCNERHVACSIFRYGQCNTQIEGTTAVVCRMVVCENPSTISELHCSASQAVDDSTCGHDVPCLEPQALELAGAGGV